MSGGIPRIGRSRHYVEAEVGDTLALPIDITGSDEAPSSAPVRSWLPLFTAVIVVLVSACWIGLVVWERIGPPLPEQIITTAALAREAAAPLAFLAVIYLLVVRTSHSEATRFGRISARLRGERARLEASLASAALTVERERVAIQGHTSALMAVGEDAAGRLEAIGERLRSDIDQTAGQANALNAAAGSARRDITALLSALPQAQARMLEMTRTLSAAGLAIHEQSGALEAQVAALVDRAREADEVAGGAAQKLAAQLAQVESVSESAGRQLVGAAKTMTSAIDAALSRAAAAADAARQGMEAQGAAMLALVDQGEAAISRTGAEAANAIARRVDDMTVKIVTFGDRVAEQRAASDALIDGLEGGIARLGNSFATVDSHTSERIDDLSIALAALVIQTADLGTALHLNEDFAEAVIERSETLKMALRAITREIDETLPAALTRLDANAASTIKKIADLGPQVAEVEQQAGGALDRLVEAEAALTKQQIALDGLSNDAATKLAAAKAAADSLVATVESVDARTQRIADGAGSTLIEAMLRVREAGQIAAEHTREALASIVPDSAGRLATAARTALSDAVSSEVEAQIGKLASTAERAVSAASAASDRLMRQMLTIAETSAQVEARIGEARGEIEEADRDNFARRVALLIESLNSTAIDVTKVLSNDVTDGAWSAYLKGDRGVFTRRAVRLLDGGEVREVTRHYNEDPEFRDQVNRYVHDFEAMLRNILATRAGSPLGVTLLSSDMGKLYVALAQAIDRLRS